MGSPRDRCHSKAILTGGGGVLAKKQPRGAGVLLVGTGGAAHPWALSAQGPAYGPPCPQGPYTCPDPHPLGL